MQPNEMQLNLKIMKSLKTFIFAVMLLANFGPFSFASKALSGTTIVDIAGLILDSKTLMPISDATIYDDQNNAIGVTDTNGFFITKLNLTADREVNFTLIVKKTGYRTYTQKEQWANLGSHISVTYYFGMQNTIASSKPFSEFVMNETSNSYDEVKKGFEKVKVKIDFEHKIEEAKIGNDNLFFEIDKNYYLINKTGWLKLNSADDNILINGKKITVAREINSSVKRSAVKRMTTSENKDFPFQIFTY